MCDVDQLLDFGLAEKLWQRAGAFGAADQQHGVFGDQALTDEELEPLGEGGATAGLAAVYCLLPLLFKSAAAVLAWRWRGTLEVS